MKFTELKCPACGGALKIDKDNSEVAVCEYCNTQFAVEKESIPIRSNRDLVFGPPTIEKTTGWEPYGWKRGLALGLGALVIMAIAYGPKVYNRWKMDHNQSETAEITVINEEEKLHSGDAERIVQSRSGEKNVGSSEREEKRVLTGALAEMAEMVFGLPAEEIPATELEKVKWIEAKSDMDYLYLGYSFDNPLENEEAELTWFTFPYDAELGEECLQCFSGLKKVELLRVIDKEDIQGLKLESVGGYFTNLSELADALDDVSMLKELKMEGEPESLEGLERFSGLHTLVINGVEQMDIDIISCLPELKSFSIEGYEGALDLSVLGIMDDLEQLSIDVYEQKDFDFLREMDNLRSLEIKNAGILSTGELEGLEQLEVLKIERCEGLRNMDAISKLTGLKELALELPYDCPEPELRALNQLEKLKLSQFNDCSFISDMELLTSLELHGCTFGEGVDLSKLKKLESLTCNTFMGMQQSLEFVKNIPLLKKLDLRGVSTYEDISEIFNMPNLIQLDISGMECEINFENIKDNSSLEVLKMDGILLYENVTTGGENGFMWADWDDVILDEHTEFLVHFPQLRELSVRENKLTHIEFVESLPVLESIDISDNYVSELRPLTGNRSLREVICKENPIVNDKILDDKIVIISE